MCVYEGGGGGGGGVVGKFPVKFPKIVVESEGGSGNYYIV